MKHLKTLKSGAAPLLVAVLLAGCSGGSETAASDAEAPEPVQQTQTPTTEEPTTEEPTTEEPTTEEPTTEEPEPTPEGPETFEVGDLIERPTADLVVNVLEERESIATPNSIAGKNVLTPGEGERLWYVDITWTNNLPEAVSKECHGPYAMQVHAFDLQGREMLMIDQPGSIEGQNCQTGLMQGQTGTWLTAFHGLDEEFGWLVFNDYNGEIAAVVLDPNVRLEFQD